VAIAENENEPSVRASCMGGGAGGYRCVPVGDPKPSKVMVMHGADVSEGEFTLEVRTKIGNAHSTIKNIKSGSFAKSLTAVK